MIKIAEKMISLTRLTQNQQKVMAKILAAPTPLTAFDEISRGESLIAARDILQKLGLIDVEEDKSASVTDKGMAVLKDMNIVDDTGELTDEGRNKAYDEPEAPPVEQPPLESLHQTIVNALNEGKMKDLVIRVNDLVAVARVSTKVASAVRDHDSKRLKKLLKELPDYHDESDKVLDLAMAKLMPKH